MKLIELAQSYAGKQETLQAEASRRVFPLLVQHAEYTLRAGVALSWDDYLRLDPLERLAFTRAGDRIRADEAQRRGLTSQSMTGAAAATIEHDDGAALELLALEATHAAQVEEVSS